MPEIVDMLAADVHAQLAADWALFRVVEADGAASRAGGLWRCWETTTPVVVLGRHAVLREHVLEETCQADAVPIVRRFSGGGTVVLGPGCVSYAVALPIDVRPELAHVADSFARILESLVAALQVPGLTPAGETDLALEGRKVSGNAQRRGRRALLQHGTLLHAFDPDLAARYLREPARRPAYRGARRHDEFIGNLPLSAAVIRERLAEACRALGAHPGPLRPSLTYA